MTDVGHSINKWAIPHKVGDSTYEGCDSAINITLCSTLSSLRNTFVVQYLFYIICSTLCVVQTIFCLKLRFAKFSSFLVSKLVSHYV